MFIKTRGIVIRVTKVSDSGAVVNIYTEQLGMMSFFVKGIQGKKTKAKASYFQPLTILNLVFRHSRNDSLQSFSDIELSYNYKTAATDIIKRTQLFFVNELLYKTLKEESPNHELFLWILNSLKWLDLSDKEFVNFHLIFMAQLSKFLGFYPIHNTLKPNVFDLQEGNFISEQPFHPNYIKGELVKQLSLLMNSSYEKSPGLNLLNSERKDILTTLINYYSLQLPSLGKFKSVEVLSAIFD